jgi:MoxR-like ATPase
LLVRALAHLLGCTFHRIQFTPDLSPTDIIGTNAFNPATNDFALIKGPIFTTFLLADEINRAPAKTQSALLQAMQEHQVTIDRQTYPLSANFTVFATQNPIESEGTYPLPEAQKDRFLIKIIMDYPKENEELELAERTLTKQAPEALLESGVIQPILTAERLAALRESLDAIAVRPELVRYVLAITRLTRNHSSIKVGAGPRATQALLLSARVHAAIQGRDAVVAEDVRRMALPCLEHRLILKPNFVAGVSPAPKRSITFCRASANLDRRSRVVGGRFDGQPTRTSAPRVRHYGGQGQQRQRSKGNRHAGKERTRSVLKRDLMAPRRRGNASEDAVCAQDGAGRSVKRRPPTLIKGVREHRNARL